MTAIARKAFNPIAAALLLAGATAAAEPRYHEVDLSAVRNARQWGINNAGVIALQTVLDGQLVSLFYDGARNRILQTFASGDTVQALSDNGNAAGRFRSSQTWFYGRDGRVEIPLQAVGGVNSQGDVAGQIREETSPFATHAAVYSTADGTLTRIGLGGNQGGAVAINSSGQVAGTSSLPGDGPTHAFRWEDGIVLDLGSLDGDGGSSTAAALDEQGRVVGTSETSSGAFHAFLFDGDGMHDLGTLPGCPRSEATAINDAGTIVGQGRFCDTSPAGLVFVYSKGQMLDLNAVAPAPDGYLYVRAFGINDAGSIIGFALSPDGSRTRPFLLVRGG